MIQERGTVLELKSESVAVILCQKSSSCEHCASMEMCHLGSESGGDGHDDGKKMLVEVGNDLGAKVGDTVRVATSTGIFLQSSFIVYIIPLIALFVGALTGKFVGESFELGLSPDLLSALFGVVFLVGSFMTIKVGTRALSKEAYMPKIIEIVED